MTHHLKARFWWILVGRGALGILLGAAALGWFLHLELSPRSPFGSALLMDPFTTLAVLLFFLGLYALTDGIFSVLLGFQDFGDGHHWWGLVACGVLTLGLGSWAWIHPDTGVLFLFYWIALWALITGTAEVLQGLHKTEYQDRKKQFLFAGLCSLAFGLVVILLHAGGSFLLFLYGAYALLLGIPMLVLGTRLRDHLKRTVH
ncbi:MAG TPA: DUF308 domain-containing protein [bacterium]|nr:DUF308 domain-containing protein [bacterium]